MAHLQTPWVTERLGIRPSDPLREFIVLKPGGALLGGVDAIAYLMRRIWWAWPLWLAAKTPLIHHALWAGYRWIAARRHCLTGSCAVRFRPPRHTVHHPALDWIPLLVFTGLAFLLTRALPAWALMWNLAFALYAGSKWLTWKRVLRRHVFPGVIRSLGYLLFWVGMDPAPFFNARRSPIAVARVDWLRTSANTAFGAFLIWRVAAPAFERDPLAGAWVGMIGTIMTLHFGLFRLLALGWRKAGIEAQPIMRAPVLAASLSEFWGERWNRAFNDLVSEPIFRPCHRRFGAVWATMIVFLVSGLVHDLIISIPARGGYGLPTLYFLIQGLGVLLTRSRTAKRMRLHRGLIGWLLTAFVTAAPLPLLFHTPFRETVILPFLQTLNAL